MSRDCTTHRTVLSACRILLSGSKFPAHRPAVQNPLLNFSLNMADKLLALTQIHTHQSVLQSAPCVTEGQTGLSDPSLKGKGKAIPLQALTGPEVSRSLRLFC
jgi:hypothetical protein